MGLGLSSSSNGVVLKEWLLPNDHILKLVHDITKHTYELKVDNIELSRGIVSPFEREPVQIEFRVEGSHGIVKLVKGGIGVKSTFSYNLVIDGASAPDSVGRIKSSPYGGYNRPSMRKRSGSEEADEIYDIIVTKGVIKYIDSGERKDVRVIYEIETVKSFKKRGIGSRASTSYHSYHEFHDLHKNIVNTFQLLSPENTSSLPRLPRWYPKFLVDHTSEDFIEKRRVGLQTYLNLLVKMPSVLLNTDVLNFLAVKSIGLSISNINIGQSNKQNQPQNYNNARSYSERLSIRETVSTSLKSDYGSYRGSWNGRSTQSKVVRKDRSNPSLDEKVEKSEGGESKSGVEKEETHPFDKEDNNISRSVSDSSLESVGLLM